MRAKAIGGCADGQIIGPESGGYREWRAAMKTTTTNFHQIAPPVVFDYYRLENLSYARSDTNDTLLKGYREPRP